VGKGDPKTVDVKFIFATNVDLKAEAQAGRFPFDLYQRLAQSQIKVPALKDRRDDIATLAEHFLDECKGELEIGNATFAPSLLRHLVQRDYPGNIRELRNLIREIARRAAFELDTVLTREHLPEAFDAHANAADLASLAGGGTDAAIAAFMPPPRTPILGSAAASTSSSGPPIASDKPGSRPPASAATTGADDDSNGFWNEVEMQELASLRRHRFKIAAAETELGLSSKSRTLTNHLRGLCFKALAQGDDVRAAARLVVGRDDDALLDRTVERMQSYLEMVEKHVAAHTVETLFNNLPRDYRKHVERAIEVARAKR
jgi:DNA-binding NtrC family response regulator